MTGAWRDVLVAVLAVHQRRGSGVTGTSPDTCACGHRVMPAPALNGYDSIADRRDRSFAEHQVERASLVVSVDGAA